MQMNCLRGQGAEKRFFLPAIPNMQFPSVATWRETSCEHYVASRYRKRCHVATLVPRGSTHEQTLPLRPQLNTYRSIGQHALRAAALPRASNCAPRWIVWFNPLRDSQRAALGSVSMHYVSAMISPTQASSTTPCPTPPYLLCGKNAWKTDFILSEPRTGSARPLARARRPR